ncbi:DEAD/DEAH box helicase family protein [Deinococcus sp. 6YEL10]|uniref:helicase-related protein n=1 Tax=Deinococcus sp. 6YEL10 TaxID=2745870 RepID=UPI001E36A9FC|nr:helicase-related protein [Deinococcus sp. 6YEL10]MCD0161808.1 DEAD/DEAH box helicase family protein [Deinococcus sp. 6YEL10]
MIRLFPEATRDLAQWLEATLPQLSPDWWSGRVVSSLSFQQQRLLTEKNLSSLRDLDLAALLRVLDQNWYDLTSVVTLDRDARTLVKEMQSVRNRWAHLPASELPASQVYRDADTLGRLLHALDPDFSSRPSVEAVKTEALRNLAAPGVPAPAPVAGVPAAEPSPGAALFTAGEVVTLRSQPDVHVPVLRMIPGGVERRYEVFQDGAVATYYESQLQSALRPPRSPALDVTELRGHLTSLKLLSPSVATLTSFSSGRVNFVPYQYRPVLKVVQADRPRLLIADEVGVGKTIEAGLILKELQARMDIQSVLIICPKALVAERKWVQEMKRFDETFVALDGPTLQHCIHETHLDGEWPEMYARAILPFSLFDESTLLGVQRRGKQARRGLLSLDPPPKFDLVIVDEAHHIRNTSTYLHQAVRYFCDHAQAVLMLTATPVQLGSDDLFTLLNVLRPDLVMDINSFEQMAAPNVHINEAVQHGRLGAPGWEGQVRACLDQVARTEWGRLFLREAPTFQATYDQLAGGDVPDEDRVRLVHDIEGLYTFSALINRTRRRDIGNFTTRRPETRATPFTPAQQEVHDHLLDVVASILERLHGDQSVKFMMSTIRRQAASSLQGLLPLLDDMLEGRLSMLEAMEGGTDTPVSAAFLDHLRDGMTALSARVAALDDADPKVENFIQLLREKMDMPKNKALVFSTFRHTLQYLFTECQRAGLRVGLVHGDVPDEERRTLRQRFALHREDPDALDVLLSSEVGCEGLDFQFCDLLVNYDLPWNPMRIEQRIGRIDRYGQESESVAVVNMITPGTVDADIYERCLMRIGVFHQAVGGNEEILGEISQEIHSIAESFNLSAGERQRRLQQLADNRIRQLQEEQRLEARQADLFGLSVPDQRWKEELAAANTFWLSPASLQNAVDTYLRRRLGVEPGPLGGERPLKNLRLNQEARNTLLEDFLALPKQQDAASRHWEKWLKGHQANLHVTFDQETAAASPGAAFLTPTHPLVRQAARALELRDAREISLRAACQDLPAGTYPFALYRWELKGIRSDETLVPVTAQTAVSARLLDLLPEAVAGPHGPLSDPQREELDAHHYTLWSAAQAEHRERNRQLAEYRMQSLTVSHRARMLVTDEQLKRATNDKIRLMRESELARAENDFGRRIAALQQAAESGDVRASPVLFGTLEIVHRVSQ